EVASFIRIELDQLVSGEIAERRGQHAWIGQRQHVLLRIDAQGRVLDQGIDHIRRHALIDIPVPRLVHEPGEPEVVRAGSGEWGMGSGRSSSRLQERCKCEAASHKTKKRGARHTRVIWKDRKVGSGSATICKLQEVAFPTPHSLLPIPGYTA